MARRNLWRSLLTASLLTVSGLAGVLAVAPPPAGAAASGASLYEIHLSENGGFSPGVVDVKVGDYLAFVLDTQYSASDNHSVTWDDTNPCPNDPGGPPCWPELRFNDPNQKCTVRNYVIPNTRCILVREGGAYRYHDRLYQEAGGTDFQGLVRVTGPPTGPPDTTTTTARPATTTTTVPVTTSTRPATTTTTDPGSIHPLLLNDPAPTTTSTTAPPVAPVAVAGADKPGAGASPPTAPVKDKGKSKPEAPATTAPTTAAPAAPAPVLDAAALTPGPVALPDTVAPADPADGSELDGSVLGLLQREAPVDNGSNLLLIAVAALAVFLLGLGIVAWCRRSSRYFPA